MLLKHLPLMMLKKGERTKGYKIEHEINREAGM